MQQSKDVCLLMLKARGILHALDFTHMASRPQSMKRQLDPLNRLTDDLHEASIKIDHTQFAPPPTTDPAHVQLLTSFATLLTAIVTKLTYLEGFPASCLEFNRTSESSSAMFTAFHILRSIWSPAVNALPGGPDAGCCRITSKQLP